MRISAHRQDQPREQVSSRCARSKPAPFGPNHHSTLLLHLQRTIGNKAVHRMLETSTDAHDAEEAHATAVLRQDGGPTLRRQPDPNPRGPKTPPLETIPKKEEGEGKSPIPAEAPCNVSSGGALPCTPKGVSIDEFLKKGPPRNALGVTRYGKQKLKEALGRYALGANVLKDTYRFLGFKADTAGKLAVGTGIVTKGVTLLRTGELALDFQVDIGRGLKLETNLNLGVNPKDLTEVRKAEVHFGLVRRF
jgi:hypothetical protein